MNRASAATAMVLTAIVAARFTQPAMIHSQSASAPFTAQVAAARAGDGRTKAAGAKKASARDAADSARTNRTRKAQAGSTPLETGWLIKTKSDPGDRQAYLARPSSPAAVPIRGEAPVAAVVHKTEKTASPEQLCADSSNFVSRGFCETRVCLQAEWTDHAFCVRKREQDMRSNPLLAASS